MAEQHPQGHEKEPAVKADCGIFNFLGKKEEKPQEEEKPTLVEELHRSHSSSSSSSDEEVGGEKKKKKNKGLKEKMIKACHGGEEITEHKDLSTPVEKHDEVMKAETTCPEEKKGILEKIKEKLPGQHKKDEEVGTPPATPPEGEPKEKKGIFEKIKEKLPGHQKNGEGAKEKDK